MKKTLFLLMLIFLVFVANGCKGTQAQSSTTLPLNYKPWYSIGEVGQTAPEFSTREFGQNILYYKSSNSSACLPSAYTSGSDCCGCTKIINTSTSDAISTTVYGFPVGVYFTNDKNATVGGTTSSTQYTIPASGWYCMQATGNTFYLHCDSNPTVAIGAGQFSFIVAEGATVCLPINQPKCAYISPTAVGYLTFGRLQNQ